MEAYKKYLLEVKKCKETTASEYCSKLETLMKEMNVRTLNELVTDEKRAMKFFFHKRFALSTIRCYAFILHSVCMFLSPKTTRFLELARFSSSTKSKRRIDKQKVRARVSLERVESIRKQLSDEQMNFETNAKRIIDDVKVSKEDIKIPVREQINLYSSKLRYRMGVNVKGQLLPLKTMEDYRTNMIKVYDLYSRDRHDSLRFLVEEIDQVIGFFTAKVGKSEISMYQVKKFENVIVQFLPLATRTYSEFLTCFEKYNAWLLTFPKHIPGVKKVWYGEDYLKREDTYVIYDWEILVKTMEYILKGFGELKCVSEKKCETRLLIMLFIYQAPRRSKDYTRMKVIQSLSEANERIECNYAYLNEKDPQFVFNFYKTRYQKPRAQRIKINHEFLRKELLEYYNRFRRDKEYLFSFKDELTVQRLMQLGICKRYGVPFRVNPLRHLYATWFNETHPPDQLEKCAEDMGTRVKDLHIYYITPYISERDREYLKVYPPKQKDKIVVIEDDYDDDIDHKKNDNSDEDESERTLRKGTESQTDKRSKNGP
jgi:hypothetical protein